MQLKGGLDSRCMDHDNRGEIAGEQLHVEGAVISGYLANFVTV